MKTRIPYYEESNNPNKEGVKYVVIQTDSFPPRVAHVYRDVREEEVIKLSRVFTPMHIAAARTLFDFMSISEFYKNKRVKDSKKVDQARKALEAKL